MSLLGLTMHGFTAHPEHQLGGNDDEQGRPDIPTLT